MPYAETTAGSSLPARMDWKSALVGGGIVMVMAYVGLVAPAWRQVSALEGHVAKLASAVAALNATQADVDRGSGLLASLEAQAARLADAEAMLGRVEAIEDRILDQAGRLDGAAATLARIDDLHGQIDGLHERIDASAGAIDSSTEAIAAVDAALGAIDEVGDRAVATRDAARESTAALAAVDAVHEQLEAGLATLDTAALAAGRLAGLSARLAEVDGQSAEAAERLDSLLAIQDSLLATTADVAAADAALVRLTDLAESLGDASGTVGRLQRFVVDIMLLEPAVGRAVRALEPVVEFTRAGRRLEGRDGQTRAVAEPAEDAPGDDAGLTEVARIPVEESR